MQCMYTMLAYGGFNMLKIYPFLLYLLILSFRHDNSAPRKSLARYYIKMRPTSLPDLATPIRTMNSTKKP